MPRRSAVREFVLDAWSAISYKAPLKDEAENTRSGHFAKTWLTPEGVRRLNAYLVLSSYDQNSARHFITGGDDDPDENREYGDASLVIDQVLSSLLGETQEIVVQGAEDYDPKFEDTLAAELATAQAEFDAAEEPEGKRPELTEDDQQAIADNREAGVRADLQEFLRDWADRVHLELRIVDAERQAVSLGDAVYLLGWDEDRGRVVPAVMDPGCYFPVLPDNIDQYEYPTRVHFAWQLDGSTFPDGKDRLRRLTYEVKDLLWDIEPGRGLLADDVYTAPKGMKAERDGRLTTVYPWTDGETSTVGCYVTDATWVIGDTDDSDVDTLTFEKATFEIGDDGEPIRDQWLGIDFLPIIHIPNTPPGGNHFGASSLAKVLQILDDLQSVDTDTQKASATTGSPITIIHGADAPAAPEPRRGFASDVERQRRISTDDGRITLGAGDTYFVGESGGATVLDTSGQLSELRNLVTALRDRLSVNSRLPAALLGTMKPSEAPSGYAIQLTFGPLTSMIRQMRLTRAVKYPLMLKYVHRLYQVNDPTRFPPGENYHSTVAFGSFLPADRAGVLETVKSAQAAKLISMETAVGMLVEAGFPIEDIAEEIERIEHRDYEGANEIADATNDGNRVREYLGLPPVDIEQVNTPNLPPVNPGGEGGDPPTPPISS